MVRFAGLFIAFVLAATMAALANFGISRPLDNDEAVELCESVALEIGTFEYFVHNKPSQVGQVGNYNESLPIFLNRFAWAGIDPQADSVGAQSLSRIRWLHVLFFAVTASLLFGWTRRIAGSGWAFFGVVILCTGAYPLLMNQFLTRNAITPIWSLLAAISACAGLEATNASARRNYWLLALPTACILGLWSYTSFRPFAIAAFGALFWMRRRCQIPTAAAHTILTGALLTVGLTVTLASINGTTEISRFALRGSSVLVSWQDYFLNLVHVAGAVFRWQPPDGTFVAEVAHRSIASPLFSPLFAPFLALGFWRCWRSPDPRLAFIPRCLLLFLPLSALGGPNIRHPLVVFPLLVVVLVAGASYCARLLADIGQPTVRRIAVATGVILFSVATIRNLTWVFDGYPATAEQRWLRIPEYYGSVAREALSRGDGPVWLYCPMGREIVKWTLLPFDVHSANVRTFDSWDALQVEVIKSRERPKLILVSRDLAVEHSEIESIVAARRIDPAEQIPKQ
jgi:hypothetical protein